MKWHGLCPEGDRSCISFSVKIEAVKAFKLSELVAEKSEEVKKKKRPVVTGKEKKRYVTPSFAQATTKIEFEDLVGMLRIAGKACLFCDAMEYMPLHLFPDIISKFCQGKKMYFRG